MSVSIRNVNNTIHVKSSDFKFSVPAKYTSLAIEALRFSDNLEAEDDTKATKRTKRRGRSVRATKATPAPVVEATPEVEVAHEVAKKAKPAKRGRPAKATPAPAPATKTKQTRSAKAVPVEVAPAPAGKQKVADVVQRALAEGVTSKTVIFERLKNEGFRPGPIAIYFTNQVDKGNLILKGDTVSLPS